ncbi:hypothetical protein Cgig2_011525 [Carnegiea gigantea]|uniref:Transmembrane protein n=1 Tax=Carnegiea gigantea TaxID=171969 RepID=A0A9Q1GUN7_9CARY|nr:hypothetical protein Cgig2_011525 [Carnegiea gigantea]
MAEEAEAIATSGFSVSLCRAMKKKETEGPRESGLMRNKEEKMKRLGMGNAVLYSATAVLGLLCGMRKKKKDRGWKRSRAQHISVASDDVGDEETQAEGGEEGSKGGRGDEQNNENESVWPQSVHLMETHDMGIVDGKMGRVVGGDELDNRYDCCILLPNNGRQPDRPPSNQRES